MARRKKGQNINGWLILDKPVGLGSTQAVSKIRALFNAQKAGHAGTLDPLASGLLPVALGQATKTVPFVQEGRKIYRFSVHWGLATDTDDAEGAVIAASDHRPGWQDIEAALPSFTGQIMQTPPAYSAVKLGGARAYDLARAGKDICLEPRPVKIDRLELISAPDCDTSVFEATCGKGTYIRALARDLAGFLGAKGHITALRRLQAGPFCEQMMISLDILQKMRHMGDSELKSTLHPVETALDDIPALAVSDAEAQRLYQGQAVILRGKDAPVSLPRAFVTAQGSLVAIGKVDKGRFLPKRVFHL